MSQTIAHEQAQRDHAMKKVRKARTSVTSGCGFSGGVWFFLGGDAGSWCCPVVCPRRNSNRREAALITRFRSFVSSFRLLALLRKTGLSN
jgi:hypothetical protein